MLKIGYNDYLVSSCNVQLTKKQKIMIFNPLPVIEHNEHALSCLGVWPEDVRRGFVQNLYDTLLILKNRAYIEFMPMPCEIWQTAVIRYINALPPEILIVVMSEIGSINRALVESGELVTFSAYAASGAAAKRVLKSALH